MSSIKIRIHPPLTRFCFPSYAVQESKEVFERTKDMEVSEDETFRYIAPPVPFEDEHELNMLLLMV